ncbi:MAG: cupin domain-containing protein [Terriglobales bacterium]
MKNKLAISLWLLALPAGLFAAAVVYQGGQGAGKAQAAKPVVAPAHITVGTSDLKWTPLFLGLESAVVSGDPSKAGAPFVMRVRARTAAAVPAHRHPQDENVTVLAGTIKLGMGAKYDEKALHPVATGAYSFVPKNMRHFAWHAPNSVIQIHGTGPFEIYFVNPAEDPRKPAGK